ncbi:MAG: sigma-54-dependent Fis family transcriptional regulator [Syntrophaceae bacterium]|nr:sigma-54-dependent Fis family transcriptional regulator [Syntrophaceae bacterium]
MVDETKIIVIDDEPLMRITVQDALMADGYKVAVAETGKEGLALFTKNHTDILITDLKLPDMDGVQVLKEVKAMVPETQVIMITAYGSIDSAVRAMKAGASDYLTKPFAMDELLLIIKRLVRIKQLEEENLLLRKKVEERYGLEGLVGKSPQMLKVYDLIETVSQTDTTVLLYGESGTGKEVVANAIHLQSPRKNRPFVKVNCAALPETLLESELFGHEKGAFTGALKQRKGRFEMADGGTLFLDEIGDIAPGVQVKLLRVLQERQFERVGGNETISVDVRLICATQRDLKEEIQKGTFREDLYYRLNVVPIMLPALRERREDILLLADHFIDKFSKKMGKEITGLSEDAKTLLFKYSFPGNIRELENMLERAIALLKGKTIQAEDLPEEVCGSETPVHTICEKILASKPLSSAVRLFEKEYIQSVLEKTKGKKGQAAEILGISRKTLWEKIKELEIEI